MARRLTAEHVDSLVKDTTVVKAYLTGIHADVLLLIVIPQTDQGVSDSLNSWNDVVAYTYLAPPGPLSRTIVDKFIRNGSINGNNLSLRDGLSWVMSPAGPVNISLSDLGAFLDDDVRMNQGFLFTDSMSFGDAARPALGNFRSLADSISLTDLVSAFLISNLSSISSDSFTLSDSLSLSFLTSLGSSDSLSFADSIALSLISSTLFSDSMSLSDSLALNSNAPLSFTDSMSFLDSFSSSSATLQDTSVSDSLNLWSDSVAILSSTGETTYLRQYLNDVVN